jgi:Histidine kinase-, DNA gyrase B-, and HSP90-like ATPase
MVLTVRDAGAGLPLQSLDSLSDAFYTTKRGGMGIGLFVSRSIVERCHLLAFHSVSDGMTDPAPECVHESPPDLPRQFDFAGRDTRAGARVGLSRVRLRIRGNTKVLWRSPAKWRILCLGRTRNEQALAGVGRR